MTAQLKQMIERGAPLAEISAHLDALEASMRVSEVLDLGKREQSKLFDIAKDKVPLELHKFVPSIETTIVYEGRNTLPTFSRFQKKFYRRENGEVAGYNHNSEFVSFFAGPGYFLTYEKDGELVFDYTKYPASAPPDWPKLKMNKGRLIPSIVFGNQFDYNRYVSKDTVIGAAFKGDKSRDAFYVLTRGGSS